MASVDPRRTQPFCDKVCVERCCRCARWPLYQNRFGVYVCAQDEEDAWNPGDPLPISGLLPDHWYISSGPLWQDAGVTPAINDGDVVGRWEDIAANADHVNQANAGNKPTLQSGAADLLNGQPVVRSDGIDDYLQGAYTNGGALAQPFVVFAVVQMRNWAANRAASCRFLDGDDGVNRMIVGSQHVSVPDDWVVYAGAALSGGATDGNANIWTVLFNGATGQVWINGTSIAGPGNVGAHNADGLTILAHNDGSSPWDGDIAEVIIYDANLSDADKNQVGQYLATRYALSYTSI